MTAQVGEADNPYRMKLSASLPPAPGILQLYRNWQQLYSGLYQRLSLRLRNKAHLPHLPNPHFQLTICGNCG